MRVWDGGVRMKIQIVVCERYIYVHRNEFLVSDRTFFVSLFFPVVVVRVSGLFRFPLPPFVCTLTDVENSIACVCG